MLMLGFSLKFPQRFHDDTGAYTVIGLIAFVGMVIPLIAVLQNTSLIANASSQGHGMAYNLSYAAINRAVDEEATGQASTVIVFQEQRAGSPGGAAEQVYSDIDSVKDSMVKAAELGGGIQGSTFELEDMPNVPLYTGGAESTNTAGDGVNRTVGLVNVPFAYRTQGDEPGALDLNVALNVLKPSSVGAPTPLDNLVACDSRYPNPTAFGETTDGSGQVFWPGIPQNTICWVDGRARDTNNVRDPSNPNPALSNAWAHFASGAQVNLKIHRDLPFGEKFDGTQVGVSTFGRPCDQRLLTPLLINGSYQDIAGVHCGY